MALALMGIGFLILFFLGTPVFVAMGVVSAITMLLQGVPLEAMFITFMTSLNSWAWLAIPCFLLAGNLMNATGITERLIDFSQSVVGHIKGGLSHVTVVTNVIMAGMSGSSLADAAATGAFLIPAMKKAGYPPGYAAGIVATSCIIGPIIPPSIGFVIFGILARTDITRLFLGGIVPGLVIGASLIVTGYWIARKRNYPSTPRAPISQVGKTFFFAIPALVVPVLIIGGMRLGQFTPTEAAGIAVVYVVLIGWLAYRKTRFGEVEEAIFSSVKSTAAILVVVAASTVFGYVLILNGVQPVLKSVIADVVKTPLAFLFMTGLIMLIIGCFFDTTAALIVLAPLLAPIASAYGISLVHFGVLFVFLCLVGVATPPYGLSMFLTCRLANTDVWHYARESWPLLLALVAAGLLLTLFPPLVTWLPDLVMGGL